MASPSSALATLRPDLAGSLMEFDLAMNFQGMVSTRILPVTEVQKPSGKFGKIPIEQLLQQRETRRAPGTGYSRGNFTFTDASFVCEEHGAEEVIDDRESLMYAEYFDHELVSTMRAYSSVLVNQEKRVADMLFNTSTYTGSSLYTDLATTWATSATATPIADVLAASKKVYDGTGLFPNALICNRFVWRDLIRTAQIIDAIEASGAGQAAKLRDISTDMVARALDLDMVIVADSTRNTATEGQTAAPGQIWSSSYAMVARICTTNDIREPGLGRIFHYAEDGSSFGGTVETYRDESVRGDVVRVRHDVDELILYTECAHLMKVD